MRWLLQSTARTVSVLMLDAAGAGKTGLTLTITASKNGGAFSSISPTVTELTNGWYALALTTSHTDTLGDLVLYVTGSGAEPSHVLMQVVAINFADSVRAGLTALPNASAAAAGGLFTRGTGAGQINQDANGRIDVNVAAFGGTGGTFSGGRPETNTTHWGGTAVASANVLTSAAVVSLWSEILPGSYSGSQAGKMLADILVDTGTTLQGELDGIQADTEDIQSRLPAALVSGRMDAYVGAMGTNVVTAAAVATDAVAEIQNGLATQTTLQTIGNYVDTEIAQLLSDTNTLLTRLSSTRAGYLDNLSAGAVATAAAVSNVPNAVLAAGDIDGYSLLQSLRLTLAALAGKVAGATGAETSEVLTLRAANDSKTRITATCDQHGNRTAVTLDAT